MKKLLFITAIVILILQNISAQPFAPSDYFPLGIGNHWTYETVFDTTNSASDRWSFIDVVDTVTFGIPGETISYKVEYSENLYGHPDTSIYRIAYYSYNTNGDLGYTAFEADSLIVLDSLAIFLKNSITVGDSIFLGLFSDTGESTTVVSITDTLTIPLGYFENCLHLRIRSFLNGQPLEVDDKFYIPISYLPTAAGIGRSTGIHWYVYPDSSRYGYSNLVGSEVLPVDVENAFSSIPLNFSLMQNYPNPFNPSTTITYSIPEIEFVTLKVYDVLGNEIAILVNEEKSVGNYEVEFYGTGIVSGIYFYRLQAGSFVETKKMVLLK